LKRQRVEWDADAAQEAREARDWYAAIDPGLATRFDQAIEKAGETIAQAPDRWPVYLDGTRRYIIQEFKYLVIYEILGGRVFIVAFHHGHRKPGYWRRRRKRRRPVAGRRRDQKPR
jgi:toxin ParE1/3/4